MAISAPDLTQRAPRSPRVRLGGYAVLPRMLDKGRATIIGKNGEFHYDCPMDQIFLEFVGVSAADVKKELAKGKGDGEILAWIDSKAKHKRSAAEIAAWSAWFETRTPSGVEMRGYFHDMHTKMAPKRGDIATWFDLLDVDDFVTFGGKA